MSGIIDGRDPRANMYGVLPCPECKSVYRWPTENATIVCDECGFVEPAAVAPNPGATT